ncbi:uncharacterized protein LOC117180436 [Belonocnema kinseyi]|uniref:uncharacterized protein LOC117180436 n=1 Tax=Belonocnema kinseyi TaxID=2817044 RepID=UPI00143DC2F3|nr:uncharacterized protein LOC117180436 [Belonocnema kinseyi]
MQMTCNYYKKPGHFERQCSIRNILEIKDSQNPLECYGVTEEEQNKLDNYEELPFFNAFDRYHLTENFIYVDNRKLPLYEDGTFLPGNTAQITRIKVIDKDQDIYIENDKLIPDGIYKIENQELFVPLYNYDKDPLIIQQKIKYEAIEQIKETNRMSATSVEKTSDIYILEGHPFPCTDLVEHEIGVKTGKIVNLKSYRSPECHKDEIKTQMHELKEKGVIRDSKSPFNSPHFRKKETPFDWPTNCQESFYKIKELLCSAPVLRFSNYKEKFTLTTGASNHGIGAVLSQNGRPCCYISRTLNKAEINYNTTEKEPLAIVWACKRLRQYLLERMFIIQTDHQALIWLHNVKDPSSRWLSWRLRLKEYRYIVEYVKGKENKVAVCLSRLFPIQKEEDSLQNTPEEVESDVERGEELIGEETASTYREENVLPEASTSASCLRIDADLLISDDEGLTDGGENLHKEYKK